VLSCRADPTPLLMSSLQRLLLRFVRFPHRLLLLLCALLHGLLRFSGCLLIGTCLLAPGVLAAGPQKKNEAETDEPWKKKANCEFLHQISKGEQLLDFTPRPRNCLNLAFPK